MVSHIAGLVMRILIAFIFALLAATVEAANPSFSSFNTNQIGTNGNLISIKPGAPLTNIQAFGLTNNAPVYTPTNYAPYTITTNFPLNTFITNGNQRAFICQSFDCTAAAAGVGIVGLYVDQNADGTFEQTGLQVGFPIAIVSVGRFQAGAFLQPGARCMFTNLSSGIGGGATNVVGSGQLTAQ